MASHSSALAWKIPWVEEPGSLQSMGSLRVGLSNFTFTFPFIHWRRKWQPSPVFLPGESQGRQSLVGCRLWGRTESDTTEATQQQQQKLQETVRDREAWHAAVPGVAKSRTRLSDLTFTFHLHALEKEMATHSSVLAWSIPGTGEPSGLSSMGSHRVRHD